MEKVSGNGSWQKLIANIYGMNKTNITLIQNYKEYSILIRPDEILMQNILSLVKSSYYGFNISSFDVRGKGGDFWEKGAYNSTNGRALLFYNTFLLSSNYYDKGLGFPVRWGGK